MKIFKISLLFLYTIGVGTISTPALSDDKSNRTVSMQLNASLIQTKQMNPSVIKLKKIKADGIKILTGPLQFNLLYGPSKSLQFDHVKLIIFQAAHARVSYIHIFPQVKNLSLDSMMALIKELEKKLVLANWLKQPPLAINNRNVLYNEGIGDYAHYHINVESPVNGITKFEVVLTTFVDVNVRCEAEQGGRGALSQCKNRFVRVGVNKLNG